MTFVRRTVAAILLCVVILLAAAAPAVAQARDPFRAPGGTGLVPADTGQPPPAAEPALSPPGTGALPRTGQDLVVLITAALAFVAAGGALRLTGRALVA